MPKAEVGSTKYLNNKLKSKGLQRLRWYCQVCERQMRDENGFKMHTQSESHVRQMLLVGEDPKKFIQDYSNQFQRDFLQLLRTSHGEKRVHMNHFYQEYISNKEHVHMNSTKWPSLMEFAKYLGREGICRVEEDEKGIHVAWIDNSPENLRRQDAIRRKERQDRGDEEREQMAIRDQIRRAKADAESRGEGDLDEERELKRAEGEKIKLSFGAKPAAKTDDSTTSVASNTGKVDSESSLVAPSNITKDNEQKGDEQKGDEQKGDEQKGDEQKGDEQKGDEQKGDEQKGEGESKKTPPAEPAPAKVSLKMGFSTKPKNVFAAAKKNPLGGKKAAVIEQPKKMSEAERIMREEMERKKRGPPGFGGPAQKKQKF